MRKAPIVGLSVLLLSFVFLVATVWGHIPPGATLVSGYLTGGGSIFLDANDLFEGRTLAGTEVRVTHGFELHCSADILPDNLEVNIHPPGGTDNRFKLEMLTWAGCWDDASIEPNPPAAPFDHYFGRGVGRYNGVGGYCAQWLFTDAGEPGTADRIKYMLIWTGNTCSAGDPNAPETVVLSIAEPGHLLNNGNHQAHKENSK